MLTMLDNLKDTLMDSIGHHFRERGFSRGKSVMVAARLYSPRMYAMIRENDLDCSVDESKMPEVLELLGISDVRF